MATFYCEHEIEIYPDEIMDTLSDQEKHELYDMLKDEYSDAIEKEECKPLNHFDKKWNESLKKLTNNRWRFSNDEYNQIINLANKF